MACVKNVRGMMIEKKALASAYLIEIHYSWGCKKSEVFTFDIHFLDKDIVYQEIVTTEVTFDKIYYIHTSTDTVVLQLHNCSFYTFQFCKSKF